LEVFRRCGIEAKITEASGGDFTKSFSHEFMAISPAGEDTIIYCDHCTFAQNTEIANVNEGDSCPHCSNILKKATAIEIGNIFDLGRKFTDAFDVSFTDESGEKKPVYMGCYGIGSTRLLGTVVELRHDSKGIIWPPELAPYNVHLIGLDMEQSIGYGINQNHNSGYEHSWSFSFI
jgi:prolyl-tRNA synthetase